MVSIDTVVRSVLGVLETAEIAYVVSHDWDSLPHRVRSDIDIVIARSEIDRAYRAFVAAPLVSMIRCYWYGPIGFRLDLVAVDAGSPVVVGIDVCGGLWSHGEILLDGSTFLQGRRLHREGFFIPAPGKVDDYVQAKRKSKARVGWAAGIARWMASLARPISYTMRVRGVRRLLARLRRPIGFWCVVLGPDGSGKSLLVSGITEMMHTWFRGVDSFHLIPGSRARGTASSPIAPYQRPQYGSVLSTLKSLYLCLRTWCGYTTWILPKLVTNGLVIGDRYMLDAIIDPKRYRITSSSVARGVLTVCPQPDLVVILAGDPDVLVARTTDLDSERMALLVKRYDSFDPKRTFEIVHLDAVDSPSELVTQLATAIIGRMRRRSR